MENAPLIFEFENRIRLMYYHFPESTVTHVAYVLGVGSRNEMPGQEGLAHFWEHMAFKGAGNLKSYHILNAIESIGGDLNAYTTKEKICFYASTLPQYSDRSIKILSEIVFNPTFPEKEIEKERGVILEEMASYEDTPDEAISDDFDGMVFANHPLGVNVLGKPETVKAFTREHFYQFINQNLDTGKMVIAMCGPEPASVVLKKVSKVVSKLPDLNRAPIVIPVNGYTPQTDEKTKPITQAHCTLGARAYPLNHPLRVPLFMLSNIIGGPAMSSRLNLTLREKYGYVYGAEAGYSPFTDTGLFAIYFATDITRLKKCLKIVNQELDRFKQSAIRQNELNKAKWQIVGQMALGSENKLNFILSAAKSLLDLNYIDTFETAKEKILAVTSEQLLDASQDILASDKLSMLTYIPDEEEESTD